MSESDIISMELKSSKKQSAIERIVLSFKQNVFEIQALILNNHSSPVILEIIYTLVEVFQLLSFTFHSSLKEIVTPAKFYETLNPFFSYYELVYLYKDNRSIYFISYYFVIVVTLLMMILSIYISVHKNSELPIFRFIVNLYGSLMCMLSKTAFIPIMQSFLSIYICENKKHSLLSDFTCWNGTHYFHIFLGVPFMLIFLLHSLLFMRTHLETGYHLNSALCKRTNWNEFCFLFEKLIYMLVVDFIPQKSYRVSIVIMLIISLYSIYSYNYHRPDYNQVLLKAKLLLRIIFFWSMLVYTATFLIQKIYDFESPITMFLVGLPFIILIVVEINFDEPVGDLEKTSDPIKYINNLLIFQKKIDTYDKRDSKMYLRGYAISKEEKCLLSKCPLKSFISYMEKEEEATSYLEMHLELLFESGISKSPDNVQLRLCFFIFLIERLNNKHKAINELKLCSTIESKTFEEEFIIYYYNRLYNLTGEFKRENVYSDSNTSVMYQNYVNKFNLEINNVTSSYIDFWTLLYQNHLEHQQNLTQLNKFGTTINREVHEIKELFGKLQKIKSNDLEVMKNYCDFLTEVLFENEEALVLKGRIKEAEEIATKDVETTEGDGHFDLNVLNRKDNEYYIIINPHKCSIINISLGLCPILGYTKKEILGKNINILLPSIFHIPHKKMLLKRHDEFKKEKNLKVAVEKSLFEKKTFAVNKAKYLLPLKLKCQLNQTELNDVFWIVNVQKDVTFNQKKNDDGDTVCYVITNSSFAIQNFSCNCISHLHLDFNIINDNREIFPFIKEFQEDFLLFATSSNQEEKDPEEKLMIKRHIVNKTLGRPTAINWRKRDGEVYDDRNNVHYLTKTECYLMNIHVVNFRSGINNDNIDGYIFKFEKNFTQKSKRSTNDGLVAIRQKKIDFGKRISAIAYHIRNSIIDSIHDRKFSFCTTKNENKLDVQGTYVPRIRKNDYFVLDPNKLSFTKQKLTEQTEEKTREFLKNQALKKVMPDEEESDESHSSTNSSNEEVTFSQTDSKSSSNAHDSSSSSSSSSSSPSDKNVENNNDPFNPNLVKRLSKRAANHGSIVKDDYYKVNLSKIKLSVYDYDKKIFREKQFNKISKVEEAKSNHNEKEEHSCPQINSKEIAPKNKISFTGFQQSNTQTEKGPEENGGDYLLDQIKKSLNKKEVQPTIVRLQLISFIVFLIIIASGVVFNILSIHTLDGILQKCIRMKNAFLIYRYNFLGATYLREMMLLNFDECDGFVMPKAVYRNSISQVLKQLYKNSTNCINYLIANSNDLTKENYDAIFNLPVNIKGIEEDKTTNSFNLTLVSALTKSFTSLFQISQLKTVIPLDRDVFFFQSNAMNSIYIATTKMTSIYSEEIINYEKKRNNMMIFCYAAISLMVLISFWPLSIAFNKVLKRKESYLEIFFEISTNDILYSLSKCESFAQKIQNETSGSYLSVSNEDESISFLEEEKIKKKAHKKQKPAQQEHLRNTKESIVAKVASFGFLLGTIIYMGVLGSLFKIFCDRIPNYVSLYSSQSNLQGLAFMSNHNMREYFFDNNFMAFDTPISSFIDHMINQTKQAEKKYLEEIMRYQDILGETFVSLHKKIYYHDICDKLSWYFETFYKNRPEFNCDTFLYGSIRFGFSSLQTTFLEELRQIYSQYLTYKNLWKTYGFKYNYTLYGTEEYEKLIPTDPAQRELYQKVSGLKNFICGEQMKRTQSASTSFIIPIYKDLVASVEENIVDGIKTQKNIFNYTSFIYIVFIALFYLFCWSRYVGSLHLLIYKTKNMLSIIPSELLADLNSVHNLLNVSGSKTLKK